MRITVKLLTLNREAALHIHSVISRVMLIIIQDQTRITEFIFLVINNSISCLEINNLIRTYLIELSITSSN